MIGNGCIMGKDELRAIGVHSMTTTSFVGLKK